MPVRLESMLQKRDWTGRREASTGPAAYGVAFRSSAGARLQRLPARCALCSEAPAAFRSEDGISWASQAVAHITEFNRSSLSGGSVLLPLPRRNRGIQVAASDPPT